MKLENVSLLADREKIASDDIFIGLCFFFLSTICIIPYIPCMVIMATDDSIKHFSCYRLMFHYGISDIIQLAGHAIAGLVTATQWNMPYRLNKLFGGLINSSWMAYSMFAVVVALDRFAHVCTKSLKHRLFNKTAVRFWIILCWFIGAVWLLVYLTPDVSFVYFAKRYAFYYDMTASQSNVAKTVGFWFNTVQMVFMCLCYLVILVNIRAQMKAISAQNAAQFSVQKRERSLMVQVALVCLYIFLFEVYWDIAPFFMPDTKYSWAVGNVLWIFNGGVNPLVYLTLNNTIKRSIRKMFGLQEVETRISLRSIDGPSPPLLENEEEMEDDQL